MTTADSIVRTTLLKAPLDRVWRAISDSRLFGDWFGVTFTGPFVAGQTVRGVVTPSKANAELAKAQKDWEGVPFVIHVEQLEEPRLFSFRWHPHEPNPAPDEPSTLVTFALAPEAEGVRLTITESGFDSIPLDRRAQAFTANEGGWNMQIQVVAEYVHGDFA